MFWALAIRVCRALLLINTSLCVALLQEDQEQGYFGHSFQCREFQRPREFRRMSSPRNHLKRRVTGIAYPLLLSRSLEKKYSWQKTSYVGTRIVVNKVNFVIILRKETDWRLDTLQSISFPKRIMKLYFVSRYTRSYISGIYTFSRAPCRRQGSVYNATL